MDVLQGSLTTYTWEYTNRAEVAHAMSTPMHMAGAKGSVEVVQALIEAGADTNAENEAHKTPLDCARE